MNDGKLATQVPVAQVRSKEAGLPPKTSLIRWSRTIWLQRRDRTFGDPLRANLCEADLHRFNLWKLDLSEATLTAANLGGANLTDAHTA